MWVGGRDGGADTESDRVRINKHEHKCHESTARTHLILVLGGGRTIKQVGNLEQLAHRETVGAVQLRNLELDLRLVDLQAA